MGFFFAIFVKTSCTNTNDIKAATSVKKSRATFCSLKVQLQCEVYFYHNDDCKLWSVEALSRHLNVCAHMITLFMSAKTCTTFVIRAALLSIAWVISKENTWERRSYCYNAIYLTALHPRIPAQNAPYCMISHTRTVVRECFKGDYASQWKRPKFDPSPHQNPLTDLHKNRQAWLRPGRHPACKIL